MCMLVYLSAWCSCLCTQQWPPVPSWPPACLKHKHASSTRVQALPLNGIV